MLEYGLNGARYFFKITNLPFYFFKKYLRGEGVK